MGQSILRKVFGGASATRLCRSVSQPPAKYNKVAQSKLFGKGSVGSVHSHHDKKIDAYITNIQSLNKIYNPKTNCNCFCWVQILLTYNSMFKTDRFKSL